MNVKDRKYQPGKHIAKELQKFPDENLSKKQVQQFLGIVNYLRDFIPKISKFTNPLRKNVEKKILLYGMPDKLKRSKG
ncbi:hypothetical protein Goshw_027909 [Gossypium schwendimanii]|uniref:Reverse transcriptase n=1 Tax=Gossypium schwendimanii TaxID=34291 RepID=A0A7J9MQY4_GOSSC|nr:hypothetical protein [Gossypium schwendimanii]